MLDQVLAILLREDQEDKTQRRRRPGRTEPCVKWERHECIWVASVFSDNRTFSDDHL